ncbi:MAG: DUF488 family protein [candidate division NC10 bacterium]|nr:DUF488 family protein [candidate division NC10 bacterium]
MFLKRVYDPAEPGDGYRVLADRLWPRGLTRDAARIQAWLKDLAPSDGLRTWYAHDRARWPEFRRRYRDELASPEKRSALRTLAERARREAVTLVFAKADRDRNNAVVLKEVLEGILEKRAAGVEAGPPRSGRASRPGRS